MKEWDETAESVSRITPDLEKARALLKVIQLREKNISFMDKAEMSTLIIESYYKIIKELITGIMSADGYKTTSHELLIAYLAEFYKEFLRNELITLDQLRKLRNDIAYRGVIIESDYLERNEKTIQKIILKLKTIINKKI